MIDPAPLPSTPFDAPDEIAGIPHRVRVPVASEPAPVLIMMHGFQGDQDVTWIFTRAVGPEWLVASPRAPLTAARGFTWWDLDDEGKITPGTFQNALSWLERYIEGLAARYTVDLSRLVLLGFSQGGAMAYAYAITRRPLHPRSVAGVVSLGGFIPGIIPKPLPSLVGLPVLAIHGTLDETIPITTAYKNREQLLAAGAELTFYEEPVGHKVGAGGMRELKDWLALRLR
jgi:phospholipase/carboxylesterase